MKEKLSKIGAIILGTILGAGVVGVLLLAFLYWLSFGMKGI